LAAATVALYPNMDHVLVRSSGRPSTDTLDREHFLFERPILNPCGGDWTYEINRQARDRRISVLLTGTLGNITLSYDGLDSLSELFAHGRLRSWGRLARAVMRAGTRGWRGVVYHTLGPWIPGRLFDRLERLRGLYGGSLDHYTALNPALFASLEYARRTRALGLDPHLRPSTNAWRDRIGYLRHVDLGNYYKGFLGGWGVDHRDPTADLRLIELCLNIPTQQYIAGGRPRSLARRLLADRVPEHVLNEPQRGYQTADWHEAVTAGRAELAEWIGRLEDCQPAATAIDLARLRRLVEDWPTDGWERDEVKYPYRYALLRGLSVGHFLHRASGSNR
jgi:asparagine synthase (glutamine-hydrolysing)